jgi:hypothetical protein
VRTSPVGATQVLRPASASRALRPLITGTAEPLQVVAAFPRAVYLARRGTPWLVAVVTSDGVAHPNAVRLSASSHLRPLAGIAPGTTGTIGEGGLRLGSLVGQVTRWWDPRPALPVVSPQVLAERLAVLRAEPAAAAGLLADGAPAPGLTGPEDAEVAEVAVRLRAADAEALVAAGLALLGRGPGLTPAGDDVLAGLLAGTALLVPGLALTVLVAGERLARLGLARTTAISATLLRHAARGEVAEPVARVLRAMTGPHERPGPAVAGLLAVGSSSGADLLRGLLTAADLAIDLATDLAAIDLATDLAADLAADPVLSSRSAP